MIHRYRRGTPIMVLLLAACAPRLEPSVRDLAQPIQTDRLEYKVQRTDQGLSVQIPFTYENETGETVYVVNCNKDAPPALQKQMDGAWVRAWAPVVQSCLSPPMLIRPGARLRREPTGLRQTAGGRKADFE